MPSVLFICTANRFRSPLAAAIFKKALENEVRERKSPWHIGEVQDWKVGSAGTWTTPGEPVLRDVLEAGQQMGVDLAEHRSEMVSNALLSAYDLILVMQQSHRELLRREYPHLHERIYLLSVVIEYGSYDFPDTHRFLQEVMTVGAVMAELIRRNLHYICVLAIALHNKKNWLPHTIHEEIEYAARQLLKERGRV